MQHANPITSETVAIEVKVLKTRALKILDAVAEVMTGRGEAVSAEYALLASMPKSVLYHYFSDKVEMVLMAAQRYYDAVQAGCRLRTMFELSLWVAMRSDVRLRAVVRKFHFDEKARLTAAFGKEDSAALLVALRYGAIAQEIPEAQVLELQELLLDLLRERGQQA